MESENGNQSRTQKNESMRFQEYMIGIRILARFARSG